MDRKEVENIAPWTYVIKDLNNCNKKDNQKLKQGGKSFYIFGYFQLFTTMFKLLVILFIIKMYARNNILKLNNCVLTIFTSNNKGHPLSTYTKFSEKLTFLIA